MVSTSPTAGRASVSTLLAVHSSYGYVPRSVDVRTAFLQRNPIKEVQPVYVQPPAQAKKPAGVICKLRNCAYGLTDALRWWYQTVRVIMEPLGFYPADSNHSLFLFSVRGVFSFGLAAHVDDFLYGGVASQQARFQRALNAVFDVGLVAPGDLILFRLGPVDVGGRLLWNGGRFGRPRPLPRLQ